ncbi:MAG: efflux RND transporter periplasmic adaptor subunit [Acidobacteriia bacterium]|nr:efflux RND transporter periplasmic adaptor subunit [Terriglobia bacterium]
MKKKALFGFIVIALTAATVTLIWGNTASSSKSEAPPRAQQTDWLVAAPGRVEPSSEDIKLGAEISGKLKTVLVEEGDAIRRGQVLAEFENSDYRAQVESAQAEVKQKEAELRKVINGARSQERREALSSVHEAEAVMKNAEAEMLRRQKLYAAGVISREEADRYAKEYDVAKARYDEKVQNHALIDEAAREEDRSMAEANLASAIAQLDAAQALLAKTYVRAPIDGTVLRKHHRAGESVSNGSNTPDPIFTIGDKRALRVRMDVDEADVSKLAMGQSAYVTADAYGNKKFWGHVVRVGQELGRKNVRTDEPTERVDTKILETLVQLDEGVELPVGLRVDAFIVGGNQK